MKTFEDKIEDYFNEFINHPSSDNYYFFRGYVSAMFVSRNISEDQFDEYLEKARLVYYKRRISKEDERMIKMVKSNFKIVYDIFKKSKDVDQIYSEILLSIKNDELLFEDFWKMFNVNEMLADRNVILTKDYKQIERELWIKESIREFLAYEN